MTYASPRRLPDWIFCIFLLLSFIGAPFSFLVGLMWGFFSNFNPVGTVPPSNWDVKWVTVFGYGIAGLVVGVPILAVAATCVYWVFFLLCQAAKTLTSTVVHAFCNRS